MAQAGSITDIPASSRIGADGKIGSENPQAGAVGTYRGLCSKWVKHSLAQDPLLLDSLIKAERLIDNAAPTVEYPSVVEPLAGDQSQPARKGRFFARTPVLDFEQDNVEGLHSPSRPMPWAASSCRLQGTQGAVPNVESLRGTLAGRFRGNLHIEAAGVYTFAVRSDDGYTLRVGGVEIVAFKGIRGPYTDSGRARFASPGVYPFEIIYFDRGNIAALEVLVAGADICFTGDPNFTQQTPCTAGVDLNNNDVLPSALQGAFQVLDYRRVDLPTWVTTSSDPAFTVADESCATEQSDQTCGPLQTGACGNGIRERVNIGTLGTPSFADEQCDDGNLTNGDGCSSTCSTETNFTCGNGPISTCTLPAPVLLSPQHEATIDTTNPTYSGNVPGLTTATGYFVDLNLDGQLLTECTGLSLTEGNGGAFSCTPSMPTLSSGSHAVFAILRFGGTNLTPGEDNIFTVALTPPDTSIDSGPSGTISSSNAAFTFSSNRTPVTFECKLDDALVFSSCAPPLQLSGFGPGAHSLAVRAVSIARGIDPTPAVRNWTVSLPPGAPIIALPVDGKSINNARPDFVGTAPASTNVNVYLDNATTPSCAAVANSSGAFRCTITGPLTEGAHAVVAKSVNSSGLESQGSSINSFTVDLTAPAISVTSPTGSTTVLRPALEGTTEPGAVVRVYLDEDTQPLCTVTASVDGAFRCAPSMNLMVGSHRFTAEAEDSAGNVSTRSTALLFSITSGETETTALRMTEPGEGAVTSRRPRVAGVGEPGLEVDVLIDDKEICRTRVDASGTWSCVVDVDLSRGAHTATVRAVTSTSIASEASVQFVVSVGDAQAFAVGCGCEGAEGGVWAVLAVVLLVLKRKHRPLGSQSSGFLLQRRIGF